MKLINFVCTGNICRSAMAHAYLQKKVNDLGRQNEIIVSSCGTRAYTGDMVTKYAVEAIGEYGADAKNHRAVNIYDSDILSCDLILCMTRAHKRDVLSIYPNLKDKVFTLKEYIKSDDKYIDIDDPWGYGLDVYKKTAKEIVEAIDKLVEII